MTQSPKERDDGLSKENCTFCCQVYRRGRSGVMRMGGKGTAHPYIVANEYSEKTKTGVRSPVFRVSGFLKTQHPVA